MASTESMRTGILAVAAVMLAVLLGSFATAGAATPDQAKQVSVTIEMSKDFTFVPQTANVAAGTLVVFHNSASMPHDAIVDPQNTAKGGPNSDAAYPNGVPAGQSYSWSVPANAVKGTKWFYHCRFHGTAGDGKHLGTGMAGVIVVK